MLRPALLVCITLLAGTATAADPKPTLDDLLKAYTDHGLPLPPKAAKLVKYAWGTAGVDNDDEYHLYYALAFELVPATKTKSAVVLKGTSVHGPDSFIVVDIKPDPEELKAIELDGTHDLVCAIQCHSRGWDKLAAALFERSQKDEKTSPLKQLRERAWYFWDDQLTQPKIDRTPAFRRLKRLMAEDKEFDTKTHRELLRSLELALQPSTAKPGSIEALIDGLVDDATPIHSGQFRDENSEAYEQLALLGFDAVPTLLEHLDDDRLTRGELFDGNNFPFWNLNVEDRVSELIENLAAEEIERRTEKKSVDGGRPREPNGRPIKKSAAQKWWAAAKNVGEEQYLISKLWPPKGKDQRINRHALLVLRNKYPKQIARLFKIELEKGPKGELSLLAESVAKSKLSDAEKLALLLPVAESRELDTRYEGLKYLDTLDKKKFNAILLDTLDHLPRDVEGEYQSCTEATFANLAIKTDDPRARPALEKALARSSLGLRLETLARLAYWDDYYARTRRLRLQLLSPYLDDETVRDVTADKRFAEDYYPKIEVRNLVTHWLAPFYGMRIEYSKKRTPEAWAKLREQVRAKLKQELGDAK